MRETEAPDPQTPEIVVIFRDSMQLTISNNAVSAVHHSIVSIIDFTF